MTAFLSRLVERSLPGAGMMTPLPVVPPLFAPGALQPQHALSEDAQPTNAEAPGRDADSPVSEFRGVADGRQAEPEVTSDLSERSAAPSVAPRSPLPPSVPARDATPVPGSRVAAGSRVREDGGRASGEWGIRVRPRAVGVAERAQEHAASIAWAAPAVPAPPPEPVVSQENAAPIVRVSIGRIEVRAVGPVSPAPVRPSIVPPQKRNGIVLDDYLRARGKPL